MNIKYIFQNVDVIIRIQELKDCIRRYLTRLPKIEEFIHCALIVCRS